MQKFFSGLIIALCTMGYAAAEDKVVLQLKWEHEFQFAGFYAADWQGYYREAGLDVEIKSAFNKDGSSLSPVEQIANGKAQFAVGALDILLAQDSGNKLTVLAPIFQRADSALFSLADTPLDDLSQLAKLRVAAILSDTTRVELDALFKTRGYEINETVFVDAPPTVETLVSGKADAILTYESTARFVAGELGVKLNMLHPAEYGINFYGDTLFTSQKFAKDNPELIQRFIDATVKGWIYAIQNKEATAIRITNELPRHVYQIDNFLGYNLSFSRLIETLLDYPKTSVGSLNKERWFSMNEKLRSLGLVGTSIINDDFFFTPPIENYDLELKILAFSLIIFLLFSIFYFWHRRNLTFTIAGIGLLVLVLEYQIEKSLHHEIRQNQKLSLLRQLNSVTAKLEGNLHSNLYLLSGFAAYISAQPDLTYVQFKNYARELFKKEPMLVNFAAAKDLVINYVYPVEGNEKAIGLDYLQNEAQKQMVVQVAKTGQLLVIGPINLVQGGVAFVGRAPIYTGDNVDRKLWGIISAPLDAEKLFNRSGITAISETLNIAIKSFDSLGNEGPVFYGESGFFDDPNGVQSAISVGGGTWHIVVTAKAGIEDYSSNIDLLRLGMATTLLVFCAFVVFRFRQEKEKLALQNTILSNKNLLEKVGSVAKIGGWKLDKNFAFSQWSAQTSSVLNMPTTFKPKSLQDVAHLISATDYDQLKSNIELSLLETRSFDLELKLNPESSDNRWIRVIASSSQSEMEFITGTMQDVTDKVRSAQYIKHQATYDSLTNLPNRLLFNDRLHQAIETAKRNEKRIAVLFIDLDHFKPVNDNYGHDVGDRLLVEAAQRIQPCLRTSDTVARISGDEFGVLLVNINRFQDAIGVAESILENMQKAFAFKEINLYCSASIGIALYPSDGIEADELLRKADQAMYGVKKSGRNGWQFYTQEMQAESEFRHNLLNQLIEAIADDKLMPYFQPIFELSTKRLSRCETLARWQKSDGTFVPPDQFIALAEESGLVNKIDLNMLQNSARELIQIMETTNQAIGLAINVSPRLFHTKDRALETWLEHIKRFSQQIEFTVEITERLITDDTDKAFNILNQLKSFGVKIAIDDFGTGYSSLSYLVRFPVDIIKIDRSFVDAIGKESSAETLIETILIMAQKLDIQVVAEGIETQLQFDFLKKFNCDYGQGYFLAKPMSSEMFCDFIADHSHA